MPSMLDELMFCAAAPEETTSSAAMKTMKTTVARTKRSTILFPTFFRVGSPPPRADALAAFSFGSWGPTPARLAAGAALGRIYNRPSQLGYQRRADISVRPYCGGQP